MKIKYTKLFLLTLITSITTSCQDYLEVKTYGKKLPTTVEDYATIIHTQLKDIEGSNDKAFGAHRDVSLLESYSDNLNASLQVQKPSSNYLANFVGTNIVANQYKFRAIYGKIKDHNIIIENIPERESKRAKTILATSYAMRGALYFQLMRDYCEPYDSGKAYEILGLPIVKEFNMEGKPSRGSIQDVIDAIEDDLTKAISYNMDDERYHFTSDVAKAFLARTYFWGQEWQNAINIAKEVLNKYPLLKGEEYKNMILSAQEKTGNIIFKTFTNGSIFTYNTVLKNLQYRPLSLEYINLFTEKEKDIRYSLFFNNKFFAIKGAKVNIRSAEMCLIIAECYAHLGNKEEALKYLNLLREHRIEDYTPYTIDNLPPVNKQALIKQDATGKKLTPLMSAILNERRKEFLLEGDRWYELKRNGRPEFWVGVDGFKYTTEKYLYTYPMAVSDLITNPNMEQNPGYPSE